MHKFAAYRDLSEIGRGGMATVYRATAPHGNLVAIKILDRHLAADPSVRLRFQQESRLTLMHPNIVRVLEYGEHEGQPYIVMEYIAGESLDRLIARKGCLTPQEYALILDDVARALEYAHKHGVIHRDVKPSNILIRPNGQALLSDFGVAKLAEQTAYTATRSRIGSALYMSPEQAAGAYELTPASDIYALGVTTYYALCGRHPFEGENEIVVARMHMDDPPRPLHELRPSISKPVSDIVLWALHKRPAFRPQSAGQFAAEFRRALSATVLLPTGISPSVPAQKGMPSLPSTSEPIRESVRPAQNTIPTRQFVLALVVLASIVALALMALFNLNNQTRYQAGDTSPRIEAAIDGSPAAQPAGAARTPTIDPTRQALLQTPIVPTPEWQVFLPLPDVPTPTLWPRPTGPAAPGTNPVPPLEPPTVTATPVFVTPPIAPTDTPVPAPPATETPVFTPFPSPTQQPSETPQPAPTDTPLPTETATPTPAVTPTP
ncbi:MAG: protein kinase [Anaerolineae bacterium]|nr:protein kinase [Thermoflexales bacterium]MDW8407592.1 protein kinase [Anaerolineae bacterium]